MPTITPFSCIRPDVKLASRIAALPYDVYNRKEALAEVAKEPLSFLRIDRAETQFPEEVDTYDDRVYEKAAQLLNETLADGSFLADKTPCYYLYELTMKGRSQTGLVACSDIDDYLEGTIKKHENTRAEKELDRIRHVDTTNAHTGPIFLTYRAKEEINRLINEEKEKETLYDFTTDDQVSHRVWRIDSPKTISEIRQLFQEVPFTYIADGHHRCASAVKVGVKRRMEHPGYTGKEEFNRFLSVLFPDEQLAILPYNRVLRDLNGLSSAELLAAVKKAGFQVSFVGKEPVSPDKKGCFGMFLAEGWYLLRAKERLLSDDPVEGLDVSILQNHLLEPVLGILDPRTDKRIDFVGGIRGLSELEKRVHTDMSVAFSLYPTSITELLDVADAGLLMPPKSTWFEPKLRSGLFIHSLS